MICERCGCVFCWDEAPEATLFSGSRKRFCSTNCQKKGPRVKTQRAGPAKARKVCDVCDGVFTPDSEDQRRCSDPCREFAYRHRHDKTDLWNRERARLGLWPCPSGKVRYQAKREAEKAAQYTGRLAYGGFRRGWLNVYECSLCFGGWHMTSKPQGSRRRPQVA